LFKDLMAGNLVGFATFILMDILSKKTREMFFKRKIELIASKAI